MGARNTYSQQRATMNRQLMEETKSIDDKKSTESKKSKMKNLFSFGSKKTKEDNNNKVMDVSPQNNTSAYSEESLSTTDEEKDLFLANNRINGKILDKLFVSRMCRERFLEDAKNKLPKKTWYYLLPEENVEYLRQIIKAIITAMLKDHDRSPGRFMDILKIISSIYTKDKDDNRIN